MYVHEHENKIKVLFVFDKKCTTNHFSKLASLPQREKPQLAPSDSLMSSHVLTLQPQQAPHPNYTNFPFLATNLPQNCTAECQETTHTLSYSQKLFYLMFHA